MARIVAKVLRVNKAKSGKSYYQLADKETYEQLEFCLDGDPVLRIGEDVWVEKYRHFVNQKTGTLLNFGRVLSDEEI